jgi:hypothetical protein
MVLNVSRILIVVALVLTIIAATGRAPLWSAVFVLVVERLIAVGWPF